MSFTDFKDQNQVLQKTAITNPGFEMIGIINKQGRMTDSIGFDSLGMPKSKKEMFLMKIALRTSMQSDFDEDLGRVDYCMTQRGDRKYISIPTSGEKTILIVAKNNYDHKGLINNINQERKDPHRLEEIFLKVGRS